MSEEVKMTFTSRESECLNAAMKLLKESLSAPGRSVSGWVGGELDERVSGRSLLVDVVHDKYDECVSSPQRTIKVEDEGRGK